MKTLVLGLSIFGVAASSVAKDCSYETFRPQFLTSKLLYEFNQTGVGQIGFHTTDETGRELTKTTLVRDTGAIGVVEFQRDARDLTHHFAVRDVRGRMLLSVIEEKKGVRRSEIDFYSDFYLHREAPFLTILHYPSGGTHHYVGVKDEGSFTFYSVFKEAWNNAKQALLDEASPSFYFFKSPREKFLFRAKTNPAIARYVSLLSVSEFAKRFHVTGVVPSNYVYNSVLKLAQEEFGLSTPVHLTIDERIRMPEMERPICRN